MQLTEHFSLHEVVRSQAAARLGLDNTPPTAAIERLRFVLQTVAEPVRRHFDRPVFISSGFRCPHLNAIIGGAPDSRHMTGEALDFEVTGVPNVVLARWILDHVPVFDELLLEFWSAADPTAGWVHVAARMAPQANQRIVRVYTRGPDGAVAKLEGLPSVIVG